MKLFALTLYESALANKNILLSIAESSVQIEWGKWLSLTIYIKGEPELTDPFNLLINVKLRMLWNWNFFYLKEEHFYGNIVS